MSSLMRRLFTGLLLVPVLVWGQSGKTADRLVQLAPVACFEKINLATDQSMMKMSAYTIALAVTDRLLDSETRNIPAIREVADFVEQKMKADIPKNGPYPQIDPVQTRRYLLSRLPKKDQAILLDMMKKDSGKAGWRYVELQFCEVILNNFLVIGKQFGIAFYEMVPEPKALLTEVQSEKEATVALIEKSHKLEGEKVLVIFANLLQDGTVIKGFMDATYDPYLPAYRERLMKLGVQNMLEKNKGAIEGIVSKYRQ